MIAENSIEQINDLDLVEVIKKFGVDLTKAGSNYKACCPMPDHSEKTPSFSVSTAKNTYKCFGCGAGGVGPVKFVMDTEGLPWVEAVRRIAAEFNIVLQETEPDPAKKEELAKKAALKTINAQVGAKFRKNLADLINADGEPHWAVAELIDNRKINQDTINLFELGYALDGWDFMSKPLIERGLYESGIELGVIATSGQRNYDVYRNRIIFPVHNERGEVIGFGGRKAPADTDDKNPKYLNSKETPLYKKDQVLYGLYQAEKHIRKMKFAVIVEGYIDVLSFVQTGLPNTVAVCGTAITDGHAKLLKRYTDHVVLVGDGDNAGLKSNLKAVDVFLKHDFKVEICPLPAKHDPDSFAREFAFVEDAA